MRRTSFVRRWCLSGCRGWVLVGVFAVMFAVVFAVLPKPFGSERVFRATVLWLFKGRFSSLFLEPVSRAHLLKSIFWGTALW
jgi:hypothetical protein